MHLTAERGEFFLVNACTHHLDIRIDMRPRLQCLDGTVNRLRMDARDRRITNIAGGVDQTRIELRRPLIQSKPLQMGRNQLHAAIFNRHRFLDEIHKNSYLCDSLTESTKCFTSSYVCARCG